MMKYYGIIEVHENAYDYDSNQDFAMELQSPVLAVVIARNKKEAEKLLYHICMSLDIRLRNYSIEEVDEEMYNEFIYNL